MVDQGLMDTLEHTEVEEIFAAQDSSKAGEMDVFSCSSAIWAWRDMIYY